MTSPVGSVQARFNKFGQAITHAHDAVMDVHAGQPEGRQASEKFFNETTAASQQFR